ncbi:DUF4175 family protein [Winogradskyella sp. PG-2]|uniref:DUF4175 family protein n=1 Tax=Winogradskyella sp. PG-2 TaxID=754409 RepID=UPI0004586D6B|nr:DUF4175 family protein [Winogradskyella sp. PG-2]BAO75557.1 liver stage antigen, putative [Winogradskyella sp. PG-2]
MSNFKTIKNKLEQFIKRYYTNELLKGAILFFAIGLLYLIVTLFVEYMLWLNPTARTILFWTFIIVEVGLFVKFIAIPLLKLFKLRQGINLKTASKLIGNHFPEVNDKLLNVLQLNQSPAQSDLLIASIEQKSQELQPVPFKSAINFKSNTKYLKYAAIPIAILLLSLLTGKINWFSDSYERVVNYQTAYEPPAPFQFFVINESLQAIENKDFKLKVSTVGDVIPENAQIKFNGQSYFLQQLVPGEFQYTFNLPKEAVEFSLSANDVVSKSYVLEVVNTPNLVNFEMVLDYPSHTKKRDEVLKSTGSAVIPEGTKVTWRVKTKSTTGVQIYAEDTLSFKRNEIDDFEASKHLYKNYNYSITTSNDKLKDYENLAYNINVVIDVYPELSIKVQKDSIDQQSLYFYGQASDDYGLSKLQLVYYPSEDETKKVVEPITISKSNFSEFVSAFPNQLNLEEGISYQLYFEVFDNDVLHNYKRTKSSLFSYRKRTKEEEEQKQLNEQNETIKNISKTFDKLEEQDKKLEELSKTQKEKESLNFNDKKKFEDFLKRQKNQEQLMKNFNKKLQDNLEEFQKDEKKDDQFKEDLKERLKENEEQLKTDEELLKELEELKDKINKEEFTQKLEELAKQNKNKKRSMKQLLELTKRFYVMKKAEKISKQLDELSEEQEKQSEKDKENTKEAQEKLNNDFEKLQKDLDDLRREDKLLQKPMNLERDRFLEDEIKFDQKEAKEALEKQGQSEEEQKAQEAQEQQQKAKKNQKKAAKKMKQMSEMMKQNAGGGGGGGNQISEDIDTLRQILENLLLYSFNQESLMNTFNKLDVNNNKYGKYIIEQSNLREHFEHIDDSLFSLSLRQPKISEKVNSQITDVYFNLDKALGQLTENRLYQGVSSQQYAITASNELASFLSDVLDNMEMSMNPSPGSGGGGGEQLPDIIMSQEELNKKMEEGVKRGEEGKEGKGEKPGSEGKDGKEGEGEQPGEKGKNGKEGESGESGENGKSGKQQAKDGEGGQNGENGNQQGEGNQNGKEGKEGKNGKNGKNNGEGSDDESKKNDGYGEGGSEEQNGELFKIYQQQQQLRQALEDRMVKDGTIQSAGQLIKQMEEIELDLLNTGFTNQTLQKMMDVQHQLLKLENASFSQGQDTKRKSEANKKQFNQSNQNQIPTAKQYFNTTEILNRQALPLQNHFKKKIQEYFKSTND